jgi:hypothetical protein
LQQPLVSLLADGHNNAKLGQCDNTIAAIEDCADMDNPREQQQQEYIYIRDDMPARCCGLIKQMHLIML